MQASRSDPAPLPTRLVLFDGVCAVCDTAVQWLLDHDRDATLAYAPLQGPTAAAVLARHPHLRRLDTLVLVEQTPDGERVRTHSSAVLGMCETLPAPWRWLSVLAVVPSILRDPAYRAFAALRYRVFGRRESCRIPQPHQVDLFLD
ncbi:MAG: putative DCC family thiol-disulfide oxidoreductase YuxK [Myxococcota bacterium]|jgi:predicted DCC family thiol-disulfide oxidoreductase YuxK